MNTNGNLEANAWYNIPKLQTLPTPYSEKNGEFSLVCFLRLSVQNITYTFYNGRITLFVKKWYFRNFLPKYY